MFSGGDYIVNEFLSKLKNGNKLTEYVLDYYIEKSYEDNFNDIIKDMEDLQRHGCVSGMILPLIYYDDTNEFYENYKEEINELLNNIISNNGCSLNELFGKKYDASDPLILGYINKNLLAWFGFEETSYNIYEMINERIKNKGELYV